MQTEKLQHRPDIAVTYEIKVTPRLVWSILGPYFFEKVKEQVVAVIPISLFLFVFQLVVMRQGIVGSLEIGLGLTAVILGLMLFMEGLRLGLMPLGESIGTALPEKAKLWLVLSFAFVTGVIATLAEPAIATLKAAGSNIRSDQAPLLFELLNGSSGLLIASVGIGVGIATLLGIFRFVRNWGLKVLLLPSLALALILTVLAQLHPATAGVISLAWDTGAITTGPVTVPLVLALGLGVSAALGKSDSGMSGFGIVTLASLWPVIMVLATALALFATGSGRDAAQAPDAAQLAGAVSAMPGTAELFLGSVQAALQAIIPLAVLLYLVQRFILRQDITNAEQIVLGLIFALLGLALFNAGLTSGLVPLGQQAGSGASGAFAPPQQLYGEIGGKVVVLAFAALMGYGATLAEPALNALGRSVEEVTVGAFKRTLLIHAVAAGVGLGLAAGVAKIMFDLPLIWLLIPSYLLLTVVTILSDEEFTNIGWDSAGVTTGPITVPLVLAVGLGIGVEVGAPEGFGMLAMASIGPILTVLLLGLIAKRARNKPKAIQP